jgi:DNA-binding transcriptional MerR regulator
MKKSDQEEKRYYTIGEVSRMTGLEQYVLRFWEREFSELRPRKNRGGNRLYTSRDIDLINRINYLRKNEGLTIAGVRGRLTMKRGAEEVSDSLGKARVRTLLAKIRKDIEDLLEDFS